jgi:hypothetical protein
MSLGQELGLWMHCRHHGLGVLGPGGRKHEKLGAQWKGLQRAFKDFNLIFFLIFQAFSSEKVNLRTRLPGSGDVSGAGVTALDALSTPRTRRLGHRGAKTGGAGGPGERFATCI